MRKRKAQIDEINITPLTDIFLVLLIIMMVVAPLMDQRGVTLQVSGGEESTGETAPGDTKAMVVQVAGDGTYNLDGAPVGPDALSATLQTQSAAHPEGVIIEVSSEARHEAVTRVLLAAQQAGITSIRWRRDAPADSDTTSANQPGP